MNFMLLVASSDNNLGQYERNKIAAFFGYSFSEHEWLAYMEERNITSPEFITSPSYSFVTLVQAENLLNTNYTTYSCTTKEYVNILNDITLFHP